MWAEESSRGAVADTIGGGLPPRPPNTYSRRALLYMHTTLRLHTIINALSWLCLEHPLPRHSCSVGWHAGHDHHADRLSRCQRHSNCRSRLRTRRPQPAWTARLTPARSWRLRRMHPRKSERAACGTGWRAQSDLPSDLQERRASRPRACVAVDMTRTDGGDRGRGRGAARGADAEHHQRLNRVDHNRTRPLYSRVARDCCFRRQRRREHLFLGDFCRSTPRSPGCSSHAEYQ